VQHAVQVDLIQRIFGFVEAGTRQMVAREAEIPVTQYLAADRYRREVETCFRRYPLLVAHASQLRRPGDFVTHSLSGVPVLLVRNGQGRLNAFINLCRHRGSMVEPAACGAGKRTFVCPYHAWTYDPDGRLIGIPDADGFAGVDKSARGLVPLPVAERHGYVWVRPAPGEAFDIDEFLGPVGDDLRGFDVGDHVHYETRVIDARINWKLMVDTFLETYHFQFAHTRSVGPMFLPNAMTHEPFGRHARMLTPKRSMLELKGADPRTWRIREHALVLYHVFPNTVVVYVADHAVVFATWPLAIDRSRLDVSFYIPKPASTPDEHAHWKANADIVCQALAEDFAIGESMQAGFSSGANRELVIGRYEMGIPPFHAHVDAELARNVA
jgi:phenylpropionate dioxygenase-like ring-hydroxylating dioxygenase large terminal subunit